MYTINRFEQDRLSQRGFLLRSLLEVVFMQVAFIGYTPASVEM